MLLVEGEHCTIHTACSAEPVTSSIMGTSIAWHFCGTCEWLPDPCETIDGWWLGLWSSQGPTGWMTLFQVQKHDSWWPPVLTSEPTNKPASGQELGSPPVQGLRSTNAHQEVEVHSCEHTHVSHVYRYKCTCVHALHVSECTHAAQRNT